MCNKIARMGSLHSTGPKYPNHAASYFEEMMSEVLLRHCMVYEFVCIRRASSNMRHATVVFGFIDLERKYIYRAGFTHATRVG